MIRVEFVDLSGRYQLPSAVLHESQLPPAFEMSTVMYVGDRRFEVKSARPADFRKTGALRLELWPIDSLDPSELHYSLPTVAGTLPPVTGPWGPGCHTLLEDDWRQIELVSAARRAEIESELEAIRAIGPELREIRLRELEEPLRGVRLTLVELEVALPPEYQARGLTLRDAEGTIPHGFAFRARGGLAAFGQAPEGWVAVACLQPPGPPHELPDLARRHDLLLVDWCAARLVDPAQLESYQPGYSANPV